MLIDIAIVLIKIVCMIGFVIGLVPVLVWAERRGSAFMQDRRGPNRANILGIRLVGLLHPVADVIKLIVKEDIVPDNANKVYFILAPFLAMVIACCTFAVIPFSNPIELYGRQISLQVADLNVGLLYIFAIAGLGVYGIVLAGWASNNKFALLGGMRSSAQMISYEVAMGLSVIGALMVYESVDLGQIVAGQGELLLGWIPKWGIIVQPLGALIFIVAAFAETNRNPFDLPEGESEIIGFHVEYSSLKFALFFMAEYAHIVVASGVLTSLFLGGWQIPYLYESGFIFPWGAEVDVPFWAVTVLRLGAFVGKIIFLCWFFIWVRWTLPRFRYDQLMRLGWKIMLPLALINIVISGAILLL